jgi:hypothetical protein
MYWQLQLANDHRVIPIQSNAENESQRSDDNVWLCINVQWELIYAQLGITKVLAFFITNRASDKVTPSFSQ